MIKYSQGEIIVDLTKEIAFHNDDSLDVSGIMEDFFKENLNEHNNFIREKVLRKKLIFIVKNIDNEYLRFEMTLLSDDATTLYSYITYGSSGDRTMTIYILRLESDNKLVVYSQELMEQI